MRLQSLGSSIFSIVILILAYNPAKIHPEIDG